MALLVEGLGIGGETSIEEYIIGPADELAGDGGAETDKSAIKLYGPEEGLSWVAKPVTGQSMLGLASRQGSVASQGIPLMDPMVTLFGSVHENLPETGSMKSMLFPNFGSMFSTTEQHGKHEGWDEESLKREGDDYGSDGAGEDSDDNLQSPLISRQPTSDQAAQGSTLSIRRHSSLAHGTGSEAAGIGGGWQLAWKWTEREGVDGEKEGGFKRIYLHQEASGPGSRRGSMASIGVGEGSEYIQAAALVSQPALYSKSVLDQHPVGPAMAHPAETASKVPVWAALREPGVKHALIVGIFIQLLQQVTVLVTIIFRRVHLCNVV